MNKIELNNILILHKLWIINEREGICADLRYADLRYTDLSYADLRYADLRGADLRSANLYYTDLSYADLRSTILPTDFMMFYLGKETGFYYKGILRIGCKAMSIENWLDKGYKIGKQNNYTEKELHKYLSMISLIRNFENE